MPPRGNRQRRERAQANAGAGGGNNNAAAAAPVVAGGNRNRNQNRDRNQYGGQHHGLPSPPMTCIHPKGCLEPTRLIYREDIENGDIEVVHFECNNPECSVGEFMHFECYDSWEESVLTYLGSTGRARSWNMRQRNQNLWSKRGYDLAYKACGCLCGRGHIKKDVHFDPNLVRQMLNPNGNHNAAPIVAAGAPAGGAAAVAGGAPAAAPANNGNNANGGGNNNQPANNAAAAAAPRGDAVQPEVAQRNGAAVGGAASAGKKKKKGKAKEQRPSLATSAPIPHPNDNQTKKRELHQSSSTDHANHSWSTAGSPGSSSPCSYNDGCSMEVNRDRINSLSSEASGCSYSRNSCSPPSPGAIVPAGFGSNMFRFQRKNSRGSDIFGERTRNNSEGNLFFKRADMRVFNKLSPSKLNNVNIQMDSVGEKNDDSRQIAVNALQRYRKSRVQCVICKEWMQVYDRCPLIDGTFFVSPKPYHSDSLPLPPGEKAPRYLSAVCMDCCNGSNNLEIKCRWCEAVWSGDALIIGTCYTYDVFAATICCYYRRMCRFCHATFRRPQFFSSAGEERNCEVCGTGDFHLVQPIPAIFELGERRQRQRYSP